MISPEKRRSILKAENRLVEQYLEEMPQDRWHQQSMCSEWKVADVIAHLIIVNRTYSAAITDSLGRDPEEPKKFPKRSNARVDASGGAQNAIALRKKLSDQLNAEYVEANRAMEHALQRVGPEDWDLLCHRSSGAEPVRSILNTFIVDVAVHRWDVIYPFDKTVTLSEAGLPVMVERYSHRPRWWEIDLPDNPPQLPIRFRLQATDVEVAGTDFIVESETEKYMESSGESHADVTFKCDASTFVLVAYGRISPSLSMETGNLSYEGDRELADIFIHSYIGG